MVKKVLLILVVVMLLGVTLPMALVEAESRVDVYEDDIEVDVSEYNEPGYDPDNPLPKQEYFIEPRNAARPGTAARPLRIAVDAGHGGGGSTPGKRSPAGEFEWDFNNRVANAFVSHMRDNYQHVVLIRTDDTAGRTDVPLRDRTNQANNWNADLFISFHHNANTGSWGDWTGVETFVHTNLRNRPTDPARQLANAVHPTIVRAYNLRDRGIKFADFHVLRETRMPAILVEGGFMDSRIDIVRLRDNNVLRNAGIGSADAVARLYNLSGGSSQTSQSSITFPRSGITRNSNVRLRAGAGTNHEVIRTLSRGTNVMMLGRSGNWTRVRIGSQEGWISTRLITPISRPGVTRGSVNLRRGAGTNHDLIRTVSRGINVTILGRSSNGNWTRVRVGSQTGWMSTRLVATVTRPAVTVASSTALRTGNGTNYSPVRTLSRGTNVTILGVSSTGNWTRVRVGFQRGWVRTQSITSMTRPGRITANTSSSPKAT